MDATDSHTVAEPTAPAGGDPVARYARALRQRLSGPWRLKRAMVAEARDGLEDAAREHVAAGMGRGQARQRAVAEFGPLDEVAPEFQRELACVQVRRLYTLVAVGMPVSLAATTLVWWAGPDTGAWAQQPEWVRVLADATDVLTALVGVVGLAATIWFVRGARVARDPLPMVRRFAVSVLVLVVLTVLCGWTLAGSVETPATEAAFAPMGQLAMGFASALQAAVIWLSLRCLRMARVRAKVTRVSG